MAMVMSEIKGSEEVPAPRSGVAQASDALIALVRGARKRGAASMLGVAKSDQETDFVPSDPKPKVKAVLMMPRPWNNGQDFRPINASTPRRKDPSGKESVAETKSIEENIKLTENDEVEIRKMTKTDPLSIRNGKKKNVEKRSTSGSKFLCGEDCKFRSGQGFDLDDGESEGEEPAESAELEKERWADKKIESWNNLARERQTQEEEKRKTMNPPN